MNEEGYRILTAWMLDLFGQKKTDEDKAWRIVVATRFLNIHYRKG